MKINKTIILITSFLTFQISHFNFFPVTSFKTVAAETTTEQKQSKDKLLFHEEPLKESEFPQAVLDVGVDVKELQVAMEAYYEEIYTKEEKTSAKKSIPQEDIDSLIKTLSDKEPFNSLDIEVEPVEITFGPDKLQVARIIVQMPFQDAEKIQKENDILILNEALAHLGNHLIMIAYYDSENNILTPMHLTNSLNPIFYNEKIQK